MQLFNALEFFDDFLCYLKRSRAALTCLRPPPAPTSHETSIRGPTTGAGNRSTWRQSRATSTPGGYDSQNLRGSAWDLVPVRGRARGGRRRAWAVRTGGVRGWAWPRGPSAARAPCARPAPPPDLSQRTSHMCAGAAETTARPCSTCHSSCAPSQELLNWTRCGNLSLHSLQLCMACARSAPHGWKLAESMVPLLLLPGAPKIMTAIWKPRVFRLSATDNVGLLRMDFARARAGRSTHTGWSSIQGPSGTPKASSIGTIAIAGIGRVAPTVPAPRSWSGTEIRSSLNIGRMPLALRHHR